MKMKNDDAPNKEEQDPSPLWNGGMIYKVLWQLYGTIIRRTKNPSPLIQSPLATLRNDDKNTGNEHNFGNNNVLDESHTYGNR